MSETSNQATIKVQYKEDLRRFSFPRHGSFLELEKTLRNIFSFSSSYPLVVKYQDDEKDWVTCSSDVEFAAAFEFASNGILKLLIPSEGSAPVKVEETPVGNVVDPAMTTSTAVAPAGPMTYPPWRRPFQMDGWKAEKMQWKAQKKCNWQNWTPEQRAAWIQRREAWKSQCQLAKGQMKDERKACKWEQRKMWKEQKRAWKHGCGANSSEANPEDRGCCPAKWRARFVKHVTAPDGAVFAPGTTFTKTWRFRNESNEPWPLGSKLLFVGKNSDQMGGPDEVQVGSAVEPGQEVDVSVPLVAPPHPGSYVGFWRMCESSGKRFGQRVRVQIEVQGSDTSSSSSEEVDVKSEVATSTPTPMPPSPTFYYPTAPPPENSPLLARQSDVTVNGSPADLFTQLKAMGFTNEVLNARLAKKYDGNVVKIVKKLMKIQRRELLATRRT